MFKLTIEDDEGKTTVVPLARDEMTIGRLEGNTIRLTERNVSRRHARLVRQNGALFIEDLSSFCGVRVNGAKIASPTALREGDEVQIGDYRLALRGEKATTQPIGDRPTMPSMPAVMGPMTVGGSVAIPTRASVAAMVAQPATAPVPVQATQPFAPSATPAPMPFTAPQPLPEVAPAAPVRKSGQTAAQAGPAAAPARTSAPAVPAEADVPTPAPTRAAAAPEVSEAQPTIPIRTLGDPLAAGPPARMFALTTDIAGTEFPLDRPSLVIGRTDENDIVVAHRSISRHHAKIVRDGNHYTIVDLQSANGVRVNGEDYERIELNSGDVVELGHVKLRFVGPNESFVFDPRAATSGGRVPVKWAVAGAMALFAVVAGSAVVHRMRSQGQLGGALPAPVAVNVPAETAPPAPPAAAPPPPPAAAAPEPTEEPAAPVATTPAALIAEAKQAAGAEDWEKARTALDRMGATIADPAIKRDALALRRRVDTERPSAVLFTQFVEAVAAGNWEESLTKYKEIPLDSIYKKRAKPRYDEARASVVAEHLATAEKARAAGRCAEVRAEAEEVTKIDPRNLLAKDMVRLCKARPEPPAVATRRAPPRPSAPVAEARSEPAAKRQEAVRAEPAKRAETPRPEPARSEAAAVADSDGPDADALMKQAREAWMRQQCGSAIDLSRKALHAKPGMTDAYQIIAVCSCTLKDGEAAGRAYAKLDDKNRNLVHALCQKNGISVGD